MIYYLKGNITEIYDDRIVLECRGVGYEVFCKDSQKFAVSLDQEVKLYIFEHIQETFYNLYGFEKKEELEMLKILISVKNIGPKVGLKILNTVTVGNLINAIEQENINLLPPIKSVGPKVKQRLVNELKGKIPENLKERAGQVKLDGKDAMLIQEAMEGLMALGLTHTEAMQSIENAPEKIKDTGELIKWALKNR